MSTYLWLLDAGHGGMNNGKYTTAPAKMHVFDDGLTFYEGVNNRHIVNRLIQWLQRNQIDFMTMHDEVEDTPLKQRVLVANAMHAQEKRCIYLSIHSDAMPDGAHGKGSGFAIYTSPGQTGSDSVASIFTNTYRAMLPEFRLRADRTDGDDDREENFYVLRKTTCPAILVENLFFDNRQEAEFLLSDRGRQKLADALFVSILTTEKMKPL